ncbi:MAG: hypothetical protein V9H26_10325 [Verrucomicrobiota bacterium]
MSSKSYRAADVQVTALTQSSRPTAVLAKFIAQELSPRSSDAVVLLDNPRDTRIQPMLARHANVQPVRASWPGDSSTTPLAGDKLLEIEVLRATLQRGEGPNPSLAVHLEARATLLRADDGREIYSCPVYYRGPARKFTAWAAHDARQLRDELDCGYRELSGTVIDQMATRHLIAPDQNAELASGRQQQLTMRLISNHRSRGHPFQFEAMEAKRGSTTCRGPEPREDDVLRRGNLARLLPRQTIVRALSNYCGSGTRHDQLIAA